MLLMGLTVSLFFLVIGFVTEGIFFSLLVLVATPLYILIAYIMWRFFWFFLVLGPMVQFLFFCATSTGAARVAGSLSRIRIAPGGPVMPVGDALAIYGLIAFVLALGVVVIIGFLLRFALDMTTPSAPVRKSRPPVKDYPPLDSPEWDDPKPRRARDLWRDDR